MPHETRATVGTFQWIDVVAPSEQELNELAKEHSLHPSLVQDCLDPIHLPKIELIDHALFIIVRVCDPYASLEASTIREMTRKVAIFISGNTLLTIHRIPLAFLETATLKSVDKKNAPTPLVTLLFDLLKKALLSYESPLQNLEERLEKMEGTPSTSENHSLKLLELHSIRNRLATFKRLFWHTLTVIQRIPVQEKEEKLLAQDSKETVDGLLFFSDELLEDSTSLISLEISMASERTNQIIRVLTIFSVFFMPLTFIVGIYGMNFEHIPEFKWLWGYPFVWTVMLVVTLVISLWFRSKKWL